MRSDATACGRQVARGGAYPCSLSLSLPPSPLCSSPSGLGIHYSLKNVGMEYDRSLFGMKLADCRSLAKCLEKTEVSDGNRAASYAAASCSLLLGQNATAALCTRDRIPCWLGQRDGQKGVISLGRVVSGTAPQRRERALVRRCSLVIWHA